MVKLQLKKLGLNAVGPTSFRESLCLIVAEGQQDTIL